MAQGKKHLVDVGLAKHALEQRRRKGLRNPAMISFK